MLTTPYTDQFYANTVANGGATVDLTKHSLPSPEGKFFVGGGKASWVHVVPTEDFTASYLAMLVAVAKREGFYALGAWVSGGEVFIEPTYTYDSETSARLTAESLGETAYYDVEAGESVYL